jgi:hypothetical protein
VPGRVTADTPEIFGPAYRTRMAIVDFLPHAFGRVRIRLTDGSVHTGSFRTDILSPSIISAYFYGDKHDISLPIEAIVAMESLVDAGAVATA